MRSYSKSFSFLDIVPCEEISYQQKKSSHEMRLNWSFSSIRLSIILVIGLTVGSSGKGTATFSVLQISSISAILQWPYGQNPNSISYSTIPQDQTSALLPQTPPLRISGAMQRGEPSGVCVKSSPPRSLLQKPKSASLRWPDLKKMLLGLMSRWRMKFSWSSFMAAMSCLKTESASLSGNFLRSRMRSSRVPPSQYQQTKQTQLLVLSISTNLTTFMLSYKTFSVSISLRVSSASFPTSTNLSRATILTATSMRVSMWQALKTLPYSPLPRQSVRVQFYTIFTMAVSYSSILYSSQHRINMIQLPLILVLLAFIVFATAQEATPSPPAPPALKYYVFTEECFDAFFTRKDFLNVDCIKRTGVKLLGYAVVVGAAIVKLPQIIKIVKKGTTFGVSFSSVVLETFTQLSAVAYNINRENPFSVYGETLFIAIQCALIAALFLIYADPKENKAKYICTLLLVGAVFYAALHPSYFPKYIIENAMIAQMLLFSGARLLQIIEIHKVRSTGSLSEITWILTVLGNLSRLATALVEVADDYLYKISVFNAIAMNGYILLSFLIFRNKSHKPEKRE